MLLVPDVHINARIKDTLLDALRDFVVAHPEEQTIIFVGDYIYHFAYDRSSLFALFSFFVELVEQWKTVYVLAGNHDWLGNTFVFAEAQKTLQMLWSMTEQSLFFVTEPLIVSIEWKNVLLLPYDIHQQHLDIVGDLSDERIAHIVKDCRLLSQSAHKTERRSAAISLYIADAYVRYPDLLVIHHYYTAWVSLPWQKSRFSFIDVALHNGLLDLPGLRLLSGHIHQVCSYKNYLCIGSVWYTSPLEINEVKWLFIYRDDRMTMYPLLLNPYIRFPYTQWSINASMVHAFIDTVRSSVQSYFQSSIWSIWFAPLPNVSLRAITLSLVHNTVSYDMVHDVIDPDILHDFKDIKLQKDTTHVEDLLSSFEAGNYTMQWWFTDRKNILTWYIAKKYPDNAEQYMDILRDMKLL